MWTGIMGCTNKRDGQKIMEEMRDEDKVTKRRMEEGV
jgi:hypothetical protein